MIERAIGCYVTKTVTTMVVRVVVVCELVVHAHDLGVVNLCVELNVVCCVEGESGVNLGYKFVYY